MPNSFLFSRRLSVLQVKQDRNQSLAQSSNSWNAGHILQCFPYLGRSQGRSSNGKWMYCMLVQTIAFVLSGHNPVLFSCQCLDSGQIKASPLGSPLRSLKVRCIFQSSHFLPREKLGVRSFLPTDLVRGLWWVSSMNFPTGFIAAGFAVWSARAS